MMEEKNEYIVTSLGRTCPVMGDRSKFEGPPDGKCTFKKWSDRTVGSSIWEFKEMKISAV